MKPSNLPDDPDHSRLAPAKPGCPGHGPVLGAVTEGVVVGHATGITAASRRVAKYSIARRLVYAHARVITSPSRDGVNSNRSGGGVGVVADPSW
ncbi:hypothetical protein S40285_09849 [Stachybotrys chlorohalonatus IBT 40285]|uniref:Uncharacterized protein n=1 Tax=Stachybotrys chlorohalonatus (strain IBT 40285) TaxID=1283841 RepID=A0A084QNG8_STAC4|nr:hypothetical protein S40285_09849 [Stachybotrys chlorohalonata IBT 40285]